MRTKRLSDAQISGLVFLCAIVELRNMFKWKRWQKRTIIYIFGPIILYMTTVIHKFTFIQMKGSASYKSWFNPSFLHKKLSVPSPESEICYLFVCCVWALIVHLRRNILFIIFIRFQSLYYLNYYIIYRRGIFSLRHCVILYVFISRQCNLCSWLSTTHLSYCVGVCTIYKHTFYATAFL